MSWFVTSFRFHKGWERSESSVYRLLCFQRLIFIMKLRKRSGKMNFQNKFIKKERKSNSDNDFIKKLSKFLKMKRHFSFSSTGFRDKNVKNLIRITENDYDLMLRQSSSSSNAEHYLERKLNEAVMSAKNEEEENCLNASNGYVDMDWGARICDGFIS